MQKIHNSKCNNKNTIKTIILNEQNIFLNLFVGKKDWAKFSGQNVIALVVHSSLILFIIKSLSKKFLNQLIIFVYLLLLYYFL